jgi:cytochrome c-type biogenesis protein CcmE
MVKTGTWKRDGEANDFVVTDGKTDIPAHFDGLLPDLFREGQGVVVEGSVTPQGGFAATNVLAKHDENYMPREMVEKLKADGEWQRSEAGG